MTLWPPRESEQQTNQIINYTRHKSYENSSIHSFSSASRMLLWRLKGKAATPDRLQLKCQFEHHMNLIACFKSLKQLGPRHDLHNFKIIERLELQKSIKYWQIALHCACTLRRAWLTLVKILEIRGDEGLGRWMLWCQAMGQFGQSVPAPPLKYQPHPGRRQHLRPCWITNPCTPGRNFKKKTRPRLCLKKSLGLEPKQAKLQSFLCHQTFTNYLFAWSNLFVFANCCSHCVFPSNSTVATV